MGRPKNPDDRARTAYLHVKMTPAYRAWLDDLAGRAGDPSTSAMVERLAGREGRRLGAPAPPFR